MSIIERETVDIPYKDDLAEIEQKVTTTVTLADLLREAEKEGIKQITGTYIRSENEACAIGAAYLIARKKGLL